MIAVAGDAHGSVRIWDFDRKKEYNREYSELDRVSALAFSPDGKTLLVGGRGRVALLEVPSLKTKALFSESGGSQVVAFSPDGESFLAVSGAWTKEICVWDTASREVLVKLPGHTEGTFAALFSADGKTVYSAGVESHTETTSEFAIRFWSLEKKETVKQIKSQAGWLALSPDGKTLAGAGNSTKGQLELYEAATGKEIRTIETNCYCSALTFSPDGKRIAMVGSTSAIRFWDVESGKEFPPVPSHVSSVVGLAFSPDGSLLASRGMDHTVILWDAMHAKEYGRFSIGDARFSPIDRVVTTARCVAFSVDGKQVAAPNGQSFYKGKGCELVYLYDVSAKRALKPIGDPELRTYSLSYTADGSKLAVATSKGVQFYSPRTFERTEERLGFQGATGLFLPGDSFLLVRQGGAYGLRELETGATAMSYVRPGRTCHEYEANLSRDGNLVACGTSREVKGSGPRRFEDHEITIWETLTGTRLPAIGPLASAARTVAFSPNGRLLAGACENDATVHVWEVFTGNELARFKGHAGAVRCVEFSPDGKLLASGSDDTTVLLWDVSKVESKPPDGESDNKTLAKLWATVLDEDAGKANPAMWSLVGLGDKAVTFLGQQVKPIPDPDTKQVERFLKELDSDDFEKRELAANELRRVASLVEPRLREALNDNPSPDKKKRLEELLSRSAVLPGSAEELRELRAVQILEQVATPAAEKLLLSLAEGSPKARLTSHVQRALKRWGGRR